MATIRRRTEGSWAGWLLLTAFWFGQIQTASAGSHSNPIQQIGQRWDTITYHWPKTRQADGLTQLLGDLRRLRQDHPRQAEWLIWEAIVLVTQASLEPGLTTLRRVKEARDLLLRAIEIDPKAMDGAAYLTLACLYYKVPGWPLSFGDSEKVEWYFQKALRLNPDGIESHYYYGQFLSKTGRLQQDAFTHFQKVADLPPDPTQPYLSQRLKEKARQKLTKLLAKIHF